MVEEKRKKTLGGRLSQPPGRAAEPPPAPAPGQSYRLVPTVTRTVTKSFGGRPRKHEPEAGEKLSFSVRVAADLKEQLDKAAAATGRSLSQETELRLARSFERQGLLAEVLTTTYGSKEVAGLVILLGHAMQEAGFFAQAESGVVPKAPGAWLTNFDAYAQALQAAVEVLDMLRPKLKEPRKVGPQEKMSAREVLAQRERSSIGKEFAHHLLTWICDPTAHTSAIRVAGTWYAQAEVRELLGPLLDRLRARTTYRRRQRHDTQQDQ